MNSAAPADSAPRLSLKHYLGYGLGDFAFNFYWLPLQVFLLKYYTDVLGLPSDTAGVIVMVCLIWDGLVDPYVGILASRTRSRHGRYRPCRQPRRWRYARTCRYGCILRGPVARSKDGHAYSSPNRRLARWWRFHAVAGFA